MLEVSLMFRLDQIIQTCNTNSAATQNKSLTVIIKLKQEFRICLLVIKILNYIIINYKLIIN